MTRSLVRERLYIGGIDAAKEALTAADGDVTHMLSLTTVSSGANFPTEIIEKVFVGDDERSASSSLTPGRLLFSLEKTGPEMRIKMMEVTMADMEEENLLDLLEVCLDFIEKGRKEGTVLVHCNAGVSRSASVMTAYLMRTEQRSLEGALESLREAREVVYPNNGFLKELKLFEEMGYKVDYASSLYKRFRLSKLGIAYSQGEKVDFSAFENDPGLTQESNLTKGVSNGEKAKTVYRCRKCRRVIAALENVVSHVPGECASRFESQKRKWQGRKNNNLHNKYSEVECTSMFVEPLRWMTSVEKGEMDGKLTCVKCDARLGYFNWAGVQCSCGSWITPAFQIHKNKIDISNEFR